MGKRKTRYFEKTATLLWIPHDSTKPLPIRLSLPFFHFLLLVAAALFGYCFYVLSTDIRYRAAVLERAKYRKEYERFTRELKEHKEMMIRMAGLERQLREMLELKEPKKLFARNAMGGPTEKDAEDLSRHVMNTSDSLLFQQVKQQVQAVHRQAEEQARHFREIQNYVSREQSKLAATPSLWPVKGWVTSGFGNRASPLTGEPGRHLGVDIANEPGTPIRVTADGVVTYAGWQSGYGRVVVVEHGFGFSTRYGHCDRVKVKVGDRVRRGDIIAYMGSSGRSTGSHVHYEVRVNGVPVNPERYLPPLD